MGRLTDLVRRQIVSAAIDKAMKSTEDELRKREEELAEQAYAEIVPEKLRKLLQDIPPGWIEKSSRIRINANGWQVELRFAGGKEVAVTQSHKYHHALGSVSPDTADKIQKFAQDGQAAIETRNSMKEKMAAFLSSFNTYGQLRDRWPDGKEFYEEFDDKDKPSLPSVRVAEINSMLGLPASE